MTSIQQQTGYQRPYPKMICQDLEILERIKLFSFDSENQKFLQYFVCRTGINVLDERVNISNLMLSSDRVDMIIKAQIQDCWEIFTEGENGR